MMREYPSASGFLAAREQGVINNNYRKKIFFNYTIVLLTVLKPLTMWTQQTGKILKEKGIPDHLTCLLRNLYSGQETTVRTKHATTDWFKIGKGVHQGYLLSSGLFNLYAEYIMRNAGLHDHKLESRLLGEVSTTSHRLIISL